MRTTVCLGIFLFAASGVCFAESLETYHAGDGVGIQASKSIVGSGKSSGPIQEYSGVGSQSGSMAAGVVRSSSGSYKLYVNPGASAPPEDLNSKSRVQIGESLYSLSRAAAPARLYSNNYESQPQVSSALLGSGASQGGAQQFTADIGDSSAALHAIHQAASQGDSLQK